MLHCLNARERKYKKDEIIFRAETSVNEIGLVESGSVNIVVNFYWGNSHIFGYVGRGQIFAENYAAIPEKELLCDVIWKKIGRKQSIGKKSKVEKTEFLYLWN